MNEKHEVLSFKPFLWLVRTAVIMLVLASNCLTATAQTETRVHGTVKSATDGLPLIGVNVVEKGTSNGTITDINGSYTLTVPGNSELVFTYIGFANQEVKVISGKNTYDITLTEDSKALEEVVVIGYGVQKKSVVTAAISKRQPHQFPERPERESFRRTDHERVRSTRSRFYCTHPRCRYHQQLQSTLFSGRYAGG